MPTHDEKPGWELRGARPPWEKRYEDEAERLRLERVRAWRERHGEKEAKRSRTSVPPPGPGTA